ncbi:MAG: helicase-related protein, partial [Nitrospirota bacterium]
RGRQGYVVFPLVEESEKSDLKAAKEGAALLADGPFKAFRVGLLHGKMKPAEKEAVMEDFRTGKVQLLVATTVVEVGVDVPNATVMVVEHAERFGLAQLHQLRGRVGRSSQQSYCVLLAAGFSDSSRDRLTAMLRSTSGFDIAEEDLKLRGPGEFLGTKQSGLPELSLGNIIRDEKILKAARKEVFDMVEKDPELSGPGVRALKAELLRKWESKLGLIAVG